VTPLFLTRYISVTVPDRRKVTMDHPIDRSSGGLGCWESGLWAT